MYLSPGPSSVFLSECPNSSFFMDSDWEITFKGQMAHYMKHLKKMYLSISFCLKNNILNWRWSLTSGSGLTGQGMESLPILDLINFPFTIVRILDTFILVDYFPCLKPGVWCLSIASFQFFENTYEYIMNFFCNQLSYHPWQRVPPVFCPYFPPRRQIFLAPPPASTLKGLY